MRVVHRDNLAAGGANAMNGEPPHAFTWSRDSPKFGQRYRVTIAEDGRTMEGEGTMKNEGATWEQDLCLSYVRVDA